MTRRIRVALLGVRPLLAGAPFELLEESRRDEVRRTAIISAFQPECLALRAGLTDREERVVNETVFGTGRARRLGHAGMLHVYRPHASLASLGP